MKTWHYILIGAAIGAAFAGKLKTYPVFETINSTVNAADTVAVG